LGPGEDLSRGAHRIGLGFGSERRHLHESLFPQRCQLRFALEDLRVSAGHLQVHRARRGTRRCAERLPQQVGESLQSIHVEVRFRDLLPHREVFDLLVRVLIA
jgi:hypothetical protein